MAGVSAGPRKFPMMKSAALSQSGQFKSGNNWVDYAIGAGSRICVNTTKLDLRAFDGNALDFANIVIQESGLWIFPGTTGDPPTITVLNVYDVFSTVPIITNEEEALNVVGNLNTPGFIATTEGVANTVPERALNPSQVIYGLWRTFGHSRDTLESIPQVFTSSEFGTGELVVGPELYWTRYYTVKDWDSALSTYAPSANAMLTGIVYDIPEGVELAQMARAVQR